MKFVKVKIIISVIINLIINAKINANEYMENENIVLPVIENGVSEIGDLWDCRTSAFVNENLFGYHETKNVRASVIMGQITKYNYRLGSTEDKLNAVEIDEMMKLELLAGLIKVKGSKNYFNGAGKSDFIEARTFSYDLKTYVVRIQLNEQLVDETAKKRLFNNQTKATHVVIKV